MKQKRIIKRLEDIKKIAGFQINRLKDKEAVNKDLVLKEALEFIRIDLVTIEGVI